MIPLLASLLIPVPSQAVVRHAMIRAAAPRLAAPVSLASKPRRERQARPAPAEPRRFKNPDRVFDGRREIFDFGAPNGTEVSNKHDVPDMINRAVGTDEPAAFTAVLVAPLSMVKGAITGVGLGTNLFSHQAAYYTLPDGVELGVNIVGKKGRDLVNWVPPNEYRYSTKIFETSSEQGGLYNRTMDELRIERLPDETVLKVDQYYRDLERLNKEGKARFALLLGPVLNAIARIRGSECRWGNCGYWAGGALKAAGLAPQSMWPKLNFVRAYENAAAKDPNNVHIVHLEKIWHAVTTSGVDAKAPAFMGGLQIFRLIKYLRLKEWAHVMVETPAPGITVEVRAVTPKKSL